MKRVKSGEFQLNLMTLLDSSIFDEENTKMGTSKGRFGT